MMPVYIRVMSKANLSMKVASTGEVINFGEIREYLDKPIYVTTGEFMGETFKQVWTGCPRLSGVMSVSLRNFDVTIGVQGGVAMTTQYWARFMKMTRVVEVILAGEALPEFACEVEALS